MPDLDLGPPPSRSPLPAILGAFLILAITGAAIFYFNPRSTADLSVVNTQVYGARSELKSNPGTMHIIGQVGAIDNDLYVAVTLSVKDRLRLPLFIKDTRAQLLRADNTAQDADIVPPADIPKVVAAFPAIAPLVSTPLPPDRQVSPGETATGTVLLHFSQATPDVWKGRKSATLTVDYFHQDSQTVTLP